MFNRRLSVLLPLVAGLALAGPLALSGCATTTTPTQEAAVSAAVRVATAAYITRGKTQAEQAKRAAQIQAVTASIRANVAADGNVVADLDWVAQEAAVYLQSRQDLSGGDRVLAQIVVTEVLFMAKDAGVQGPNVGAENAVRLLTALDQADRVAVLFALPA